jgi:hypothetical protein
MAGDENGGSAVFADGKKKEKEEPRYICANGSGQQIHFHTGQPVTNGSGEKTECKGTDGSGGCGGNSQASRQGTVVWTRAGRTVALVNGVQMVPRDDWAKYPADPNKMTDSNGQFSITSLHHTSSQNTPEDVETLHQWKISLTEKFGRTLFG